MIIKLRNRLIITIMAFISLIMLLAFIAIYTVSYLRINSENMEKVNSEETITVSDEGQMVMEGQLITDAYVINRISPALGVYFNFIIDADGTLLWVDSALNLDMADYEAAAAIAANNPDGGTTELVNRRWQYTTISSDAGEVNLKGVIDYTDLSFIRFLDVTESYKTLETLRFTLIGLYLVLLIVFYVLARFFATRSVQPMAEAWENQRQFIADASHELKTPISTLNANLDILYASQDDLISEQVKWLDNSKKVLGRMMTLIQSMLELAKVDEINGSYNVEDVLIPQLLDEVIDSYVPLANQKNISIVEDIGSDIHVYSNHNMIQQVIEILMDNAVKYTNDDGEIRISAFAEKGSAVIQVKNTGEGISPADIPKIFDRFYRGDKARTYKGDSYGIGLSIAKSTIEKIGGEIDVHSNSKHTCFIVKVPYKKLRRI